MKTVGVVTRGTTSARRLRRVERWLLGTYPALLRSPDLLAVDLGYGAVPVTTTSLHARLREVNPTATVVGLEIDPARVRAAAPWASGGLRFERGGFELAGLRPLVVRALNVLRQYEEQAAAEAWLTMTDRLQDNGILLEGTCDEVGRRAAWVTLDRTGPLTLTLAAAVEHLDRPSSLAERLPKALIHHNTRGSAIHDLLTACDRAWDAAAPIGTFGNRQRWAAMVAALDWPTVGRPRDGELTVPWSTVAPTR